MNNMARNDLGRVARALDENISEAEMDQLLAGHEDEIDALLKEARFARSRGEFAPLEPLHVFLRQARERFKAG